MKIRPGGGAMGARIEDIDLARPIAEDHFRDILRALGAYGVLCFPGQRIDTKHLAAFGRMFGELEINVANQFHEPGFPEVMVLSNMTAHGKPIGLADAGQGWHTDMSYSTEIALANVLYALKVPMRGRPLGETQFRNMHAAYADLPSAIKSRLQGRTATHDFAKFWDMMRARPGSRRAALTPEQRAKKPPVSQPIFRMHPTSPAAPSSTATRAMRCGSTPCPKPKAPSCWRFSLPTRSRRNISTRTDGRRATC